MRVVRDVFQQPVSLLGRFCRESLVRQSRAFRGKKACVISDNVINRFRGDA